MRELKNDNINLFLGIALNTQATFLSIWKYCQRGSLGDIISSASLNMDAIFIFSIIKDIASVFVNVNSSFINILGSLLPSSLISRPTW